MNQQTYILIPVAFGANDAEAINRVRDALQGAGIEPSQVRCVEVRDEDTKADTKPLMVRPPSAQGGTYSITDGTWSRDLTPQELRTLQEVGVCHRVLAAGLGSALPSSVQMLDVAAAHGFSLAPQVSTQASLDLLAETPEDLRYQFLLRVPKTVPIMLLN